MMNSVKRSTATTSALLLFLDLGTLSIQFDSLIVPSHPSDKNNSLRLDALLKYSNVLPINSGEAQHQSRSHFNEEFRDQQDSSENVTNSSTGIEFLSNFSSDRIANIEIERIKPPTSYNRGDEELCEFYFAESTIPNAGYGIFTSIDLIAGQQISFPEVVIPVLDLDFHNNGEASYGDFPFLWHNYHWDSSTTGIEDPEDTHSSCIPGFGAMANFHPALVNIEGSVASHDTGGLQSWRDAGADAISPYLNRRTRTTVDVAAGSELFAYYGDTWLESREEIIGLVPDDLSYEASDRFLKRFTSFVSEVDGEDSFFSGQEESVKEDLWKLITDFPFESKVRNALPKRWSDVTSALDASGEALKPLLQKESTRSKEWLREHGKCLDKIRPGKSTIPQAGRGAFTTRYIQKGELIAPAPLIHLPDRSVLDMYQVREGWSDRDDSSPLQPQLLLNYCFGHTSSTMLLCPYGVATNFINHSSQHFNAKIVWSDNNRDEWFTNPVRWFVEQESAGLSFDIVATRDIQPDEEVLIDYGYEWEEAWDRHLGEWGGFVDTNLEPFRHEMMIPDYMFPDAWKNRR